MGNVKLVNAESFGMSVVRSSARWLVIVCLATLALAGIMPPGVQAAQEQPGFVYIRGGEFAMGSPSGEVGRVYDETRHQVKVGNFYLSATPVTVAGFKAFIEASGYWSEAEKAGDHHNWRHGVSGRVRPQSEYNHPVLYVSWNDAVAFCRWMTAKTGKRCRLPTEAEWEYACRAGTTTPFNTGENLTIAQANFDGAYPYKGNRKGISRKNTVPVESFAPNGWGLYTMHGNVWEWCSDLYDESYYERCKAVGTVVNPLGASGDSTANHVLRGGGWNYSAQFCRSASRHNDIAANRYNYVGFRVVLVP